MKHITFYLDFISPYAYLAFERLPEALEGLSYSVSYQPVLFAGMLKHYGQLGPAEIPPKRDWTYRQVLWLADQMDVDLQMPQSHPFNPLPLLRLAAQCAMPADPGVAGSLNINRYVCESIFRHVWQGGADAADPQRLEVLAQHLKPQQHLLFDEAKTALKNNTDDAIAQKVFGVPAFAVDGRIFWGLDALPMLRDYLLESPWFSGPDWESVHQVSVGVSRQPG
ncbi:MAG: 2-hydroxychromene-2-carboxylate isomerase [Polaromonas sp.]|nr:2-hydroxychromene-2-carboxylate isomerase [Polaromonas sp.]